MNCTVCPALFVVQEEQKPDFPLCSGSLCATWPLDLSSSEFPPCEKAHRMGRPELPCLARVPALSPDINVIAGAEMIGKEI